MSVFDGCLYLRVDKLRIGAHTHQNVFRVASESGSEREGSGKVFRSESAIFLSKLAVGREEVAMDEFLVELTELRDNVKKCLGRDEQLNRGCIVNHDTKLHSRFKLLVRQGGHSNVKERTFGSFPSFLQVGKEVWL